MMVVKLWVIVPARHGPEFNRRVDDVEDPELAEGLPVRRNFSEVGELFGFKIT